MVERYPVELLELRPTIMRHQDGDAVWTECVECGSNVTIDEDGCCLSCGRDAVRYGVFETPATDHDAEIEKRDLLLERFRKYAEHLPDCHIPTGKIDEEGFIVCTCGVEDLFSDYKKMKEGEE